MEGANWTPKECDWFRAAAGVGGGYSLCTESFLKVVGLQSSLDQGGGGGGVMYCNTRCSTRWKYCYYNFSFSMNEKSPTVNTLSKI